MNIYSNGSNEEEQESMLLQNIESKVRREETVPVWHKANLTVEEAAMYFGIGENKLRAISEGSDCPFVLWNGSKRLIKRTALEKYLEKAFSI